MTTKAQEAARLLGRNGGKARAKSVDEKQRIAWSRKGGQAAQAKLTKAERVRRAKLRWQRWHENKAKRGQPVANRNPGLRELAHAKAIEAAVSGTAKATMGEIFKAALVDLRRKKGNR